MAPKETLWPMDSHTPGKHLVLREYLKAWVPILGRTQGRIIFIDGFAGPGEYSSGEEGSPLIALRSVVEHASVQSIGEVTFLFIEKEEDRAAHLRELIKARITLPERFQCDVRQGFFNETMSDVLSSLEEKSRSLAPSFVMIDPFGVSDTPMAVIERVLRHPRAEVYISFMYEVINRFKETREFPEHLDKLFGTNEWRSAIEIDDSQDRKAFLFELYKRQLRAAGARFVLHFELYRGNQLIYAVFFATKHRLGCTKMKEAMSKVGTFGEFAFRGARSEQLGLEMGKNLLPLRQELRDRFGVEWSPIEAVVEFMEGDETNFHPGHLKRETLKPMEAEGLLEVDAPGKRAKGTYPAGTKVRFR